MKAFLVTLAVLFGLSFCGPAHANGPVCEYGTFDEWASSVTQTQYVIYGPSLDAFAEVLAIRLSVDKPEEIVKVALEEPVPEADIVFLQSFTADGCKWDASGGYLDIETGDIALDAASMVDNTLEILTPMGTQ